MTVIVKTLVPPKQMEATQTTQYTATAVKALIDKGVAVQAGPPKAVAPPE